MHEKLIMTWQSGVEAQKDNCSLGCIKSNVATRSRKVILYSTLIQPPAGAQHPILRPPMKDCDILKQVMRVRKIIRAVKHLSYEERLERNEVAQSGEEKTLGWPYCGLAVLQSTSKPHQIWPWITPMGQPVPVRHHPYSKYSFPNIKSKPLSFRAHSSLSCHYMFL